MAGAPFSTPGNTAPVAVEDTATTVEETAATIAVLSNDTDADGDTVTLSGVGVPAHGTAATNPNGTVAYTPALNYSGADSFTYTITDNQGAVATGSVVVTVTSTNDPPVAVDDVYSTNEDVTLTVPPTGVAVNDVDPDGNTLTAIVVTVPGQRHAGAQRGRQLQLHAGGRTTAAPTASPTRSPDGTVESNVATVVDHGGRGQRCAGAVADAFTTAEDVTLSVDAPGVLGNDTDAEADALSASVTWSRPRTAR